MKIDKHLLEAAGNLAVETDEKTPDGEVMEMVKALAESQFVQRTVAMGIKNLTESGGLKTVMANFGSVVQIGFELGVEYQKLVAMNSEAVKA